VRTPITPDVIPARVYNHLNPLKGRVDRATLEYIRRVYEDLDDWHKEWDGEALPFRHGSRHLELTFWASSLSEIHRRNLAPESVLIRMLAAELYYAKVRLLCLSR
jgi:hypothetical protein